MREGAAPLPILYSFRRCPYAIRARLALAAAGLRPGRDLEVREVNLRARPPELLASSPKGTVPVLVLPERVIEESAAIMGWAMAQGAGGRRHRWLAEAPAAAGRGEVEALIAENDGPFKHHLDRFKYPNRFEAVDGEEHRRACLVILRRWSARIGDGAGGGNEGDEGGGAGGRWLLGEGSSVADWALLPFVRQFRAVDPAGFDKEAELAPLQSWLRRFLEGADLAEVMEGAWAPRQPWRPPGWLYHLALAQEWQAAVAEGGGAYRRSTRGRSLEEEGFIHASGADQIEATFRRYYADAGEVLLLTIDPRRLEAPVRWEPAPGSGERFPHIHGPLPLEAVLLAEPFRGAGAP